VNCCSSHCFLLQLAFDLALISEVIQCPPVDSQGERLRHSQDPSVCLKDVYRRLIVHGETKLPQIGPNVSLL
jgi:hypothetical protein